MWPVRSVQPPQQETFIVAPQKLAADDREWRDMAGLGWAERAGGHKRVAGEVPAEPPGPLVNQNGPVVMVVLVVHSFP